MNEKTEAFLRLAAETAPLETGMLASGESPPGAHMTRRYTGAEARELVAKATSEALEVGHGFEGAYVLNKNREHPFYAHCVGARAVERAALLAAAPDLAESLAAVEAERDALRVERDAYREYYRARQALITADDADSTSVLFAAEDRVSAARERIAALREAAK